MFALQALPSEACLLLPKQEVSLLSNGRWVETQTPPAQPSPAQPSTAFLTIIRTSQATMRAPQAVDCQEGFKSGSGSVEEGSVVGFLLHSLPEVSSCPDGGLLLPPSFANPGRPWRQGAEVE